MSNEKLDKQKPFYKREMDRLDPEQFSVKEYLQDLTVSLGEIKQMLALLVDTQVNVSDYIDDPIAKKEAAFKAIRKG